MNSLQRLAPWNWGRQDTPVSEADLRYAIMTEARRTKDVELAENLANAELALEDKEWVSLTQAGRQALSRGGLLRVVELARTMYILNPLIGQGVRLQARYVFGQGVRVFSDDEDVNEVVQEFWKRNRRVLTGLTRLVAMERELQLSGNLFFVLFHDQTSGQTDIRTIPVDQISEIITDPEDASTPWYYLRRWSAIDSTSGTLAGERTLLYPDINYTPTSRPPDINGVDIRWDTPIQHIAVGGLEGMLYGVPEVYGALTWALSYTNQLSDWATVVRSLAKFAWKGKTKGSVAGLTNRLRSSLSKGEGTETNPAPTAGSIFASGPGMDLSPIKTSGAAVSPADGKMLRQMVASQFGVSDPHLSMDVQQGALATAKDLSQPMSLKYRERQELWREQLEVMIAWHIAKSTVALSSVLRGKGEVKTQGNRSVIVIKKGVNATVNVLFPSIVERDLLEIVTAIVKAATMDGKDINEDVLSVDTIRRLLLGALSERDINIGAEEINDTVQAVVDEALRRARGKLDMEVTS